MKNKVDTCKSFAHADVERAPFGSMALHYAGVLRLKMIHQSSVEKNKAKRTAKQLRSDLLIFLFAGIAEELEYNGYYHQQKNNNS